MSLNLETINLKTLSLINDTIVVFMKLGDQK